MGFKKVKDYNEERYGDFFMLRNDGDYADVIFLYRSYDDVLVADTHYIKSNEYSGYCHCNGSGCPACQKGIRVQNKLFIPLFNLDDNKIEFFDRNSRFENQLMQDVLLSYPNPSEYVFRITRHGEAGSMGTHYSIQVVGNNKMMSYDDILKKFNATMPDYYSKVCREIDSATMSKMLSNNTAPSSSDEIPDYKITPRTNNTPSIDNISIDYDEDDNVEELDEDDAVNFS